MPARTASGALPMDWIDLSTRSVTKRGSRPVSRTVFAWRGKMGAISGSPGKDGAGCAARGAVAVLPVEIVSNIGIP